MDKRNHVLFICTYNKMRSKTAEELYRHDERFVVRSAGIDGAAPVQVNERLLVWADVVVVMEERHVRWIEDHFSKIADKIKIICLQIQDAYYFMDPELVRLLKERFEKMVGASRASEGDQ